MPRDLPVGNGDLLVTFRDNPAIEAFVARTVTPDMPAADKARRFYLAAREIRYDPDLDYSDPEIYRASSVLKAGHAYCVGKAALFAALCRALA